MAKARFIVFGVDTDGDTLIENHTDDFDEALLRQDAMSCVDFKARIWDGEQGRFVAPHVIDLALKFLNQ
jgi:hypothetical protein